MRQVNALSSGRLHAFWPVTSLFLCCSSCLVGHAFSLSKRGAGAARVLFSVTGNTIRQPSVAELACDFDVARTLVSAAPRLIPAPNFPRVRGYTIRQPSVAELAC